LLNVCKVAIVVDTFLCEVDRWGCGRPGFDCVEWVEVCLCQPEAGAMCVDA
jgi:hypothetical protein